MEYEAYGSNTVKFTHKEHYVIAERDSVKRITIHTRVELAPALKQEMIELAKGFFDQVDGAMEHSMKATEGHLLKHAEKEPPQEFTAPIEESVPNDEPAVLGAGLKSDVPNESGDTSNVETPVADVNPPAAPIPPKPKTRKKKG